jgi:hypothetical protein
MYKNVKGSIRNEKNNKRAGKVCSVSHFMDHPTVALQVDDKSDHVPDRKSCRFTSNVL